MSFSLKRINKSDLLVQLRSQLDDSLATLLLRQQDTQRAATHEENRPEHSKDTRATEQSYLARGLATRVIDLRQAAGQLAKIDACALAATDVVAIMALVRICVEDQSEPTAWWLVPAGGGLELDHGGTRIRTLTPAAPLGRALLGLRSDEEGTFTTPRGQRSFELLEIA